MKFHSFYFRCCPSCNAWASNQIGVGCLPSGEQESEIQKIISYSYEDITSDSVGEMNPQKEATICNLCEELHKKRKPIDAFTELVEIESTTEAIQDYESLTDPMIKEPYDNKDKKMQENNELHSSFAQSTTNTNNQEKASMEIESTTNEFGLDLDKLKEEILEEKEEILEEKKESKRDKEKVSTITENKEEILTYDDTSSEILKKPTKEEESFKEENKKDEELINYDETSSQVTENNNKSPNQKKVHNEEILKSNKKDTEMTEYDESSQENIIEKKTDKIEDESRSSKEVSVEDSIEKESEKHDKKKSEEAKFEKEESSGSGDESNSGSGGSDDDGDIYNGYGDNIATLKLGKSFLTYLFIKVAKVQMLIKLTE